MPMVPGRPTHARRALRLSEACTGGANVIDMVIENLLSPLVVRVDVAEPLTAAARRMWAHDIGALPVFDRERLVGIFTERDLVEAVTFRAGPDTTVAAHMTPEPSTAEPGEDVATVATRMLDLGVRHLPVAVGHRLVGMISARDLLMALAIPVRSKSIAS